MNEIIKALYSRKSVRVFTDQPVSQKEKELILNTALQAPSAGCQLLYTILDITDQSKKERLSFLCDHQTFIANAPVFVQIAANGCLSIEKPDLSQEIQDLEIFSFLLRMRSLLLKIQ